MATSAFTAAPDLDYEYWTDFPASVLRYSGTATEQRATLQTIGYRRYSWPMSKTASERATIDEFFRLRNYVVEAFYVRDPRDSSRTGVSLGTSVSGQTGFALPASGENMRDFPISTATVTVYDDGSPAAGTVTVSTDARRLVLSVAPTSGSVMTADYKYYRLVRLAEPVRWKGLAPDWYNCSAALFEVPA